MSGTILLVEDNADDESWVHFAFARARIENPIQVVRNGYDAIGYLSGDGAYADRAAYPQPIFVLLDLILPGKSGFEVLSWIKADPQFTALPVLVLSGMADLAQLSKAYQLGALTFMLKPLRAEDLSIRFCHLKRFRFEMTSDGCRSIVPDVPASISPVEDGQIQL